LTCNSVCWKWIARYLLPQKIPAIAPTEFSFVPFLPFLRFRPTSPYRSLTHFVRPLEVNVAFFPKRTGAAHCCLSYLEFITRLLLLSLLPISPHYPDNPPSPQGPPDPLTPPRQMLSPSSLLLQILLAIAMWSLVFPADARRAENG